MDTLKNLLSGKSNDKEPEHEPSGKLSGEGSHMPGSWDNEQDPGQVAAKGSGISSNPAANLSNPSNSGEPLSTEAARGTGISSAVGSSTYSPNVGSHMAASQGQANPDSMAAATSALGVSSSTSHAQSSGVDNSTASGQYSGSSAPGVAGQSVPHNLSSTSQGLGSSATTGSSAPIADSFTSNKSASDTTYAGSSAPGVAGQSVPHGTTFSSSGTTGHTQESSSAIGGAATGAAAGGLTGQSLTDRSRGSDGNAAFVEPSYTERAQPLAGSTSSGPSGAQSTMNTNATSSPSTATGLGGSTSGGTTVSKPFASDPISTEPLGGSSHLGRDAGVTAAGLGATGLAAHEAGHYTGDSGDFNRDTTTSSGNLGSTSGTTGTYDDSPLRGPTSTAAGQYSGSSAPGVSGQSVPQTTDISSSTTANTSQHHHGRDAAAAGGVGALGAAAVSHETQTPTIKDMRTGEAKSVDSTNHAVLAPLGGSGHHYHGHDAPGEGKDAAAHKDRQGSKILNELDVLPQPQESKFHNTTHAGHTAKDEYYGGATGGATGASGPDHTGRNVAAGVGAAAIGAGGIGAYEANQNRDTSNSASGLDSTGNTSSGAGYGQQYGHTASGTPSGIANSDAAHNTIPGNTSNSTGLGDSNTASSSSDHHYGRDAAAIAGVGGVGALGAHEYNKDSTTTSGLNSGTGQPYNVSSSEAYSGTGPTAGSTTVTTGLGAQEARGGATIPTTQDKRDTAVSPDTYTQQVATADPPYENKPYYKGDSVASHNYGHDAALAGGAAVAGGAGAAGLYEAGRNQGTSSSTGQSGLASGSSGTGGTGSQGYGDQYKHLPDGTPSGIALSDPAQSSGLSGTNPSTGTSAGNTTGGGNTLSSGIGAGQSGLSSTDPQSQSAHHYGRDAAIGGAGIAGTGAAAYGLSSQQKGASGTSGMANTAATTSGTTTGGPTIATHSAAGAGSGHAHDSSNYDDEPDSPTGTGETKKKRGFLSKLLHRDDPNKLHKDPNRNTLDRSSGDVPRTTHEAYNTAEGGKATHIGTDGEIGQHGQAISGYGNTDARTALPLSEAEKLAAQQKH